MTFIDEDAFDGIRGQLTIHGVDDSYAETYATEQLINFEPLPAVTEEPTPAPSPEATEAGE